MLHRPRPSTTARKSEMRRLFACAGSGLSGPILRKPLYSVKGPLPSPGAAERRSKVTPKGSERRMAHPLPRPPSHLGPRSWPGERLCVGVSVPVRGRIPRRCDAELIVQMAKMGRIHRAPIREQGSQLVKPLFGEEGADSLADAAELEKLFHDHSLHRGWELRLSLIRSALPPSKYETVGNCHSDAKMRT